MTRTLILITLLALTACGGGGDCDAGTPVLGKQSVDCVDAPKSALQIQNTRRGGARTWCPCRSC